MGDEVKDTMPDGDAGAAVVETDTQHMTAVVPEHKRLQEMAETIRQQERAKLSAEQQEKDAEAARKALEQQGQYEALYREQKAEREQIAAQIASQQRELDSYAAFVTQFINPRKESLDDGVKALLDTLSPLEQAEWLLKYAQAGNVAPTAAKAIPAPPKGASKAADGRDNKKIADDAKRRQAQTIIGRI